MILLSHKPGLASVQRCIASQREARGCVILKKTAQRKTASPGRELGASFLAHQVPSNNPLG